MSFDGINCWHTEQKKTTTGISPSNSYHDYFMESYNIVVVYRLLPSVTQ